MSRRPIFNVLVAESNEFSDFLIPMPKIFARNPVLNNNKIMSKMMQMYPMMKPASIESREIMRPITVMFSKNLKIK